MLECLQPAHLGKAQSLSRPALLREAEAWARLLPHGVRRHGGSGGGSGMIRAPPLAVLGEHLVRRPPTAAMLVVLFDEHDAAAPHQRVAAAQAPG